MGFVDYLIPVGLAAVTLVLLAGLFNMLRNGSASTSQKLMRWRVGLQAVAVRRVIDGYQRHPEAAGAGGSRRASRASIRSLRPTSSRRSARLTPE